MKRKIAQIITLPLVLAITLQLTSCGTLLYPERRGQTVDGIDEAIRRIDPAVAILDGIGLFFFVVPGLLAFAVDFYTGAIYLSSISTELSPSPTNIADIKVIHSNSHELNLNEIEKIVKIHTGHNVSLYRSDMVAYELEKHEDINTEFAKFCRYRTLLAENFSN